MYCNKRKPRCQICEAEFVLTFIKKLAEIIKISHYANDKLETLFVGNEYRVIVSVECSTRKREGRERDKSVVMGR